MSRHTVAAVAASIALFAWLAPASAQERTALVGGRLIDGFGHAPINDSVILIYDDTILDVGTVDTLPVPDSYRIVSTEGMDLLPGLWESHAHLMLSGHADYAHWDEAYADRLADEIMPASAVQLLLAGVTSARDLGAPLEASMSVKRRVETGEIPGPRLFMSGPFLQAEVVGQRQEDQGNGAPVSRKRSGHPRSPFGFRRAAPRSRPPGSPDPGSDTRHKTRRRCFRLLR